MLLGPSDSFNYLELEFTVVERSRSAQRRRLNLRYLTEILSAAQLTPILQVNRSEITSCRIFTDKVTCRCTIRSPRRAILSFVCFSIRISKVVHEEGNIGCSQWKVRKCQHPPEFSITSLLIGAGAIHIINPRALSTSHPWHTIPLPTNLLHKSHYRFDINKIPNHFFHCITS